MSRPRASRPAAAPARSRLRPGDLLALGFHGLRARPLRAVLSSLGIAIGIAAMISVIGISTSSQALIEQRLSELGTNMLTVTGGSDLLGEEVPLAEGAVAAIRRIPGVQHAGGVATLAGVQVYRNSEIAPSRTGGLSVAAVDLELLDATGAQMLTGTWLNGATAEYPTVVLGRAAAERLGIQSPGSLVWIGGAHFSVLGILDSSLLVPELDSMALIGTPVARSLFGHTGHPTAIYERSDDARVAAVRKLLPATVSPEKPSAVKVSRQSDALAAKNTVDQAFTGLLVGVGSIALLVGGIGVANTMVISVLERRREIGLRRSLGATRRHIRQQFLLEAVLLAAVGGLAGTALGWLITAIAARANGWALAIPPEVLVAGVAVTVVVGAIAGLLPAVRAARTSPTAALSS
ncbi:ABC transporter permease [Microterricola viridarii]|uniref:Putative ABC transport system permease protein n=1 Tax=Microterricola viridarii TaxID=412690 RepID=A0A1H1WDI7_9MICO|nr:ABC transporter permease [Microterricola viridarii]SDS95072.1 putative ABC transport system permease protein [Microterricola viridarii]